ncbi:hypothetical protein ACFWWC_41805 [Streptomyces sp. NPDC058642]|uniref:hypothetical protein n=1 Tax=Streptomyces sp. NPDC058642 TaxID=3346572 RepID=UPI003648CFF0
MTADPIAAGEHLASEMMRTRPAGSTFARRLGRRLQAWEADDQFRPQVESVVLIALLATSRGPDADTPETWCAAAAAALRQHQDAQLFADLPAPLPDALQLRVDQLRLLSTGLTPRSGHRWLRLADTAGEFLQPAALFQEEH